MRAVMGYFEKLKQFQYETTNTDIKQKARSKELEIAAFRRKIRAATTMEEIDKLEAENWPQGAYKNTRAYTKARKKFPPFSSDQEASKRTRISWICNRKSQLLKELRGNC